MGIDGIEVGMKLLGELVGALKMFYNLVWVVVMDAHICKLSLSSTLRIYEF